MNITISAVICTFNRSNYLRKAVQSLIDQSMESGSYEILVVDNGSTDDTKDVVTKEFADADNLVYIHEPELGLSKARNTGWRNAKGEIVAYLDDDAIANPLWLQKLLDVFNTTDTNHGAVGGKVEPIWEAKRPDWLSDSLAPALTILDWSDEPITLPDSSRWLVGANVAYPRSLLEELGGFDVSLGRKGNKLLSCEENMLHHKIRSLGYTIHYNPDAVVQHHIPASRLNKDWHLSRHRWNGVSLAIVDLKIHKLSIFSRFKISLQISYELTISVGKSLFQGGDKGFDRECSLRFKLGYLCGMLGLMK